jgi:hypothetical protein
MTNPKVSGAGADWTELLTDPDLVSHLGELLRTYRESSPEKRDQALLDAMRKIKAGKNGPVEASSGGTKAEAEAEAQSAPQASVESMQPVEVGPENSPPFSPDYFSPSSWQDRRRYPRMKCFVAVELHVGDAASPIWGNLSNTSIGGCFVETATAVPSGASVEIGLWLANGKVWIKGIILNGVVTKSTPSFGVRVKFSDLEPSARESLRHFLKFVESTTKEHSSEHAYLEKLKR